MSKPILTLLMMLLLIAGCKSGPSWEDEDVQTVSTRIMADQVIADWSVQPEQKGAATGESLIRIEARMSDGRSIESFDINHEKLLHLMVISKDLSYFNHIHPEYRGNGIFEIKEHFPWGGEYRLIADFKPTGGDPMTKMTWVEVEGEITEANPVITDETLSKVTEGNLVALSIDRLEAGRESTITFSLADEATGLPINNLEPYLGAVGHVVILSVDGERYVHAHAEENGTGPDAVFEASFPRSGLYKIWGQFQRNGQVFTVPFVVKVG